MSESLQFSYYQPGDNIRYKEISREEEIDLFERAKKGDTDAREFLIRNHLWFAARFVQAIVGGRLPEAEVTSAANLAVMTAIDRFDHLRGHRFTAYLRPFLQGAVSRLWKHHGRTDIPIEDLEVADNTDEHAQNQEKGHQEWLMEIINDSSEEVLTAHEKEVVRRHFFENKNFAEIGREMNSVSRETIRATVERALAKLRTALRRRGGKDSGL